jgi:hypothetical protein
MDTEFDYEQILQTQLDLVIFREFLIYERQVMRALGESC